MRDETPPRSTLEWVAKSLDVADVRPLRMLFGGTHAKTCVVISPDGREVVLRRFPVGDRAVHNECLILQALDGLSGLAPRLLAADGDGHQVGAPSIVTTRLPGSAFLSPADPVDLALQLGAALAAIHAQPPPVGVRNVLRSPLAQDAPFAADVLAQWSTLAGASQVLTHFDYWAGNTLWLDSRLSGVVDWSGAGVAPRGFDVSWCRLDLILLFDEEAVANALVSAYEEASGPPLADLELWDLFAAANAFSAVEGWAQNYQGLGRAELGPAVLRERLTRWVARLRA